MPQLPVTRRHLLSVSLLAVLAAGITVFFLVRNRTPDPKDPPSDNGSPITGFREASAEAGITFRMGFLPGEQGEKFKINLYDHGCGVAVGDVDGDGHEDVYLVNQLGPNALYRNRSLDRDGKWLGFEDITAQAGVGLGDRVCVAAVFADYDNDGWQDLYVTSTRGGNVLFRNRGKDKQGQWLGFEDVTEKAGLKCIMHSQTASFFDYDNDGLLDLFVTNTAKWTLDEYDALSHSYRGPGDVLLLASAPREDNILYRNRGNGTFENVTAKAGLQGKGWGGDVAIFDCDDDGYLDLLVTNMFGATQLYRNNGKGAFTDVTRDTLGRTSWGAIGAKTFDFNNDGRLDLFIADMHSDMWLPATHDLARARTSLNLQKKYSGPLGSFAGRQPELESRLTDTWKIRSDEVVFGNTFYKRTPEGKFEEISDKAGLETWWPWGIATGDFDNDGYEDVFLPSGMGYPFGYWPNALMMNNRNETFTDRAAERGIEPPLGGVYQKEKIGKEKAARSSRCAAAADFDGDGRLDLIVNNFNDAPYLFRNYFPQRNYVSFRLTGTKSNRDAAGALVKIHLGTEVMLRQVQAAGGYLSQSSRTLHFGLGDRTRIDRVEIRWPSGKKQVLEAPALNARLDLTEP